MSYSSVWHLASLGEASFSLWSLWCLNELQETLSGKYGLLTARLLKTNKKIPKRIFKMIEEQDITLRNFNGTGMLINNRSKGTYWFCCNLTECPISSSIWFQLGNKIQFHYFPPVCIVVSLHKTKLAWMLCDMLPKLLIDAFRKPHSVEQVEEIDKNWNFTTYYVSS